MTNVQFRISNKRPNSKSQMTDNTQPPMTKSQSSRFGRKTNTGTYSVHSSRNSSQNKVIAKLEPKGEKLKQYAAQQNKQKQLKRAVFSPTQRRRKSRKSKLSRLLRRPENHGPPRNAMFRADFQATFISDDTNKHLT